MSQPDELDQAYSDATPRTEMHAPPGWYFLRATSVTPTTARTGSPGLHVDLAVVDGPYEGMNLQRTFWLTGGALAISKQSLDALGFKGLKPSEIPAHCASGPMPVARAYLGYREYEGRPLVELSSFTAVSDIGARADGPEVAR